MSTEMAVVGLIAPPDWDSPSVELPALVAAPVEVHRRSLDLPGFSYRLDQIADAAPAVEAAGCSLVDDGCQIVAMEGTPFAWAGCDDETAARTRVADLARVAGAVAVSAGIAIVDAARALDARRVALCCTYYPGAWRDAWTVFVACCGFDVVASRNWVDDGIVDRIDDVGDHGWTAPNDWIVDSVAHVANDGADVVIVTGAGCRTSTIVEQLEAAAGAPVVGADTAMFWSIVTSIGLPLRDGSLGALTEASP